MRKFRLWLLLYVAFDFLVLGTNAGFLPLTPMAAAQNRPQYPYVSGAPDCILVPSGPFTAVADSVVYDNRNQGCTTWHLVYNSQGFSALNISFKSADDSGNGPGAFANWGTSGGTLATGTALPLTATTSGQATGYKYRPFIKISVTSVTGTGTIWPMLYGYRPGLSDSSGLGSPLTSVQGALAVGAASTGANPFVMAGVDPSGNVGPVRCSVVTSGACAVAIAVGTVGSDGRDNSSLGFVPQNGNGTGVLLGTAPWLYNGGTTTGWDRQIMCPTTSKISALGASTVALVAPVAGKKVRICSFTVSDNNATATTLKVVEGTGATCGTGTTDLTSLFNIGASTTSPISMPLGPQNPWTTNTSGDGACATSSAASSLEITYTWEQH